MGCNCGGGGGAGGREYVMQVPGQAEQTFSTQVDLNVAVAKAKHAGQTPRTMIREKQKA